MLMQSGDIILFKGEGLFSKFIMAPIEARYSHVGLYYVDGGGVPCIFESTSQGTLNDTITHKKICGVQLVPFEERIKTYEGSVYHRPILGIRSALQLSMFDDFISEHYATPYPKTPEQILELIKAEVDGWLSCFKNTEDDSSLFCSETVAYALRAMKIQRKTEKPANEFTPTDFDGTIALMNGYSFGGLGTLKA